MGFHASSHQAVYVRTIVLFSKDLLKFVHAPKTVAHNKNSTNILYQKKSMFTE